MNRIPNGNGASKDENIIDMPFVEQVGERVKRHPILIVMVAFIAITIMSRTVTLRLRCFFLQD
jgi:hypothetical protein